MGKASGFIVGGLTMLLMLPWLMIAGQVSINGDVAWLVHAAQHVVNGAAMTDQFYDTNPPLSFILYIPVLWIASFGVPLWYAADIYTLCVAVTSLGLLAGILRHARGIEPHHYWLVIIGYLMAVTFPARFELGQKDHLLAITLVPFLMAQFALSEKWPVPRWLLLAAFIFGAPFILMKPHYGLLPALMIAHGFYRQRQIKADFFVLATGCVAYAAVIWLWFPDFIATVMRASAILYAGEVYATLWPAVAGLGILAACLLGLALMLDKGKPARPLCVFLSAMALAAVLPVFLQFKGFSYHLLPPLALLFPAALLTLGETVSLPAILKDRIYIPVIVLILGGYCLLPVPKEYPTHKVYQNSTLAHFIREKANNQPVFIQTGSTNVIEPLSVYTGVKLATRFPSLWFMPVLMQRTEEGLMKQFRDDVTEDFERYKPSLVALYAHPDHRADFLAFMGDDAKFRKEWAHYKKHGQVALNPREYFAGSSFATQPPVIYDVYERRP
jgi:hypothetical protein